MGTQKQKCVTGLGPAPGKILMLNFSVGMVVNRCFTAAMEPSAFICGVNSNLLVIVSVGNGEDKHEYVAFLFNFPTQT